VEVLQLLLEREGAAARRPIRDDGESAVLQQQRGDRGAEAAGAAGQEDHAARQPLPAEVVTLLGMAAGLIGVEEARRHRLSLRRGTSARRASVPRESLRHGGRSRAWARGTSW